MSDAQDVMAEVAEKHRPYGLDCKCGRPINSDADWSRHVAAEIDKVLGELTRQWGVVIDYPPRPEDGYPGAVVVLDSYRMREAAELVKRTKYPEDDYEVRPRWVSGWTPGVGE